MKRVEIFRRSEKRPAVGLCLAAALLVGVVSVAGRPLQENMGLGRISGFVTEEGGTAIEGARVVAVSLQGGTTLNAATNKEGFFAIAGLGTGMWKISASKTGFLDAAQEIDVRQLRTNRPLTLILKKEKASIAVVSDPEAKGLLDQGNRLIAEGKFAEARKIYEVFLARFPDVDQIRLQIGECRLKEGDLDGAGSDFASVLEKVLRTKGSYQNAADLSARALCGLGETSMRKNDVGAAQKYFRQALDVSPADEILAYNIAETFFANQNIDEAIRYYALAIQVKKDWSRPYYKLGVMYLNKGDYEKSLEYLRRFVRLDPQNAAVAEVQNMIAAVEKLKK